MRIVGGKHRGRPIEAPTSRDVRPTSDRAREALFNILDHGRFASAGSPYREKPVLDGFAGTGALGLEALSRGASHAHFIELASDARKLLHQNLAKFGETASGTIHAGDATKPPRALGPVALALLDPPYGKGLVQTALPALTKQGWLDRQTLIVAEISSQEAFDAPDGFELMDQRIYGAATLIFMRIAPIPSTE